MTSRKNVAAGVTGNSLFNARTRGRNGATGFAQSGFPTDKKSSVGRRRAPEQALQRQIAQFLDVALGGTAWYSAIPLGGGGRVRGAILRSMGTKEGTPDMVVLDAGRAIFLELKAPKGRVSPAQEACHKALRRAGATVYVVRSLDEAIAVLFRAGVPLRVAEAVG